MEVIIKAIDIFIDIINDKLDAALPYVAIIVLISAAIFYVRSIREEGMRRCLFLGAIVLLEEVIIVLHFWYLPLWIAPWISILEMLPILRWIALWPSIQEMVPILRWTPLWPSILEMVPILRWIALWPSIL